MRTFSSAVQTVINSDNLRFAFLIKLEFNTTYYLTSNPYDLSFGGNTYIANGGLFEFDAPKFSTAVDRESYKVVISEVLDLMKAEFDSNVVGKQIDVKVVLFDANNSPLLSPADVLSVYRGVVDAPSIVNDMEQKLAILEGTSPMSDLDRVNPFITSKDGMRQRSSTDTSFSEIFENNEISIKWGKN